MVTVNERPITDDARRQPGLLSRQVERNMAEVLNEYGAPAAEPAPQSAADRPVANFGYGIPMAGVRYYTFTR